MAKLPELPNRLTTWTLPLAHPSSTYGSSCMTATDITGSANGMLSSNEPSDKAHSCKSPSCKNNVMLMSLFCGQEKVDY